VEAQVELFQIDDDGRLFMSADIDDWASVAPHDIDVVIDLEGGLDQCIPTETNNCLYVYFPFKDDDEALPSLAKLRAIAALGATLVREGHRVLTHCGMGLNRSGLMAGLILTTLGMPGPEAIGRIRERRPGALYNDRFAEYLIAQPPR
jgi:protein-tyrosine phosphatase